MYFVTNEFIRIDVWCLAIVWLTCWAVCCCCAELDIDDGEFSPDVDGIDDGS